MTTTARLEQARGPKEPSMDEILASIRKVISDDVALVPKSSHQGRSPVEDAAPETKLAGTPSEPPKPESPLLSSERQEEAAAAFASLNHVVFSRQARTIEEVVQDMLRPMLRTWLDENLPPLVERLVRQEIERISGKS